MNRPLSFSISLMGHMTCVGLLLLTGTARREKPVIVEACRVTLFSPRQFTSPAPRSDTRVKSPVRRQRTRRERPKPKPVFFTRKVRRQKPAAEAERAHDFRQLTRLEKEALPPTPRNLVRESAAVGRLSVSAGGASSFDAYIATIIKSNWVRPSRAVVGENPRPVSVAITIAMDGRITRTRITGSSGVSLLDASAVKAIERSNPLPIGLPTYLGGQYYDVTIVFHIRDEA